MRNGLPVCRRRCRALRRRRPAGEFSPPDARPSSSGSPTPAWDGERRAGSQGAPARSRAALHKFPLFNDLSKGDRRRLGLGRRRCVLASAIGEFSQQVVALGLDRRDLLEQQFEPVELAPNLRLQAFPERPAVPRAQFIEPVAAVAAQWLIVSWSAPDRQQYGAVAEPTIHPLECSASLKLDLNDRKSIAAWAYLRR